ncbi:aryl hydrocarbon receptor isoform X2 [Oryctolagus cuniculus]|uniref:aryl hydrocarbon receptor isoform X2 n=1 Tax=Oryctolagus cuniculus TaxID=9986 RepID=UPI00387A2A5E
MSMRSQPALAQGPGRFTAHAGRPGAALRAAALSRSRLHTCVPRSHSSPPRCTPVPPAAVSATRLHPVFGEHWPLPFQDRELGGARQSCSPKAPSLEGARSNPSKRHRDRLNQELNKLTSLLPFPEDVCTRLDKLSILRLTVGYLKVKGYLADTLKDSNADCSADPPINPGRSANNFPQINVDLLSEGDLLLQSDIIYQSVYELIHKEDRAVFQSQFRWHPDPAPVSRAAEQDTSSLPGQRFLPLAGTPTDNMQHPPLENSSCLERSFVCRFRCLLDNSSGFLELNFQGHLKFLPGQNKSENDVLSSPQLTLFAVATPHQPLTILELQNKPFLFQTKHKLDFTPIACDSRGKVILGYTESELCRKGSGYQFIHAADMMYCAENHVRMMRTGESGLTVFRLLTKRAGWLWVQSNARLVFRGGQPDCIVARQRALTNSEGEEHLHTRTLRLPFTFITGEAILYESSLPNALTTLPARRKTKARKGSPTVQVCPGSLLGATMEQDESMHLSCINQAPQSSSLERQGSDGRHEDKEAKEEEEGSSLLTLIDTLLGKDREEQPDLCSTLQHLGVTDFNQHLWEENLLRADLDPAGTSLGWGCLKEKEALFHDLGNVSPPPPTSMSSQTLKSPFSQSSGQLATEVTPPQNLATVPNSVQALPHNSVTTGPTHPGPTVQRPLQSPPQWGPWHSQAAPVTIRICQKSTICDNSLPETSSPRQMAQVLQPSCIPSLSLGENVPGHLAQTGPGVLDFCKESIPWIAPHTGQCQEPLSTSDLTCIRSCGSHSLDSIWDCPIQVPPDMVPMEMAAGQNQPDPFSHLRVVSPCLPRAELDSSSPPSGYRNQPLSVHTAAEETTGSQEYPPHSLGMRQLPRAPACPSQAQPHGPSATQGFYSPRPGPATKQQQWVQVELTQELCGQVSKGVTNVQLPPGCLRDSTAQAPQPIPFPSPDSNSGSPNTGGGCHSAQQSLYDGPKIGHGGHQSDPALPALPSHSYPCRASNSM